MSGDAKNSRSDSAQRDPVCGDQQASEPLAEALARNCHPTPARIARADSVVATAEGSRLLVDSMVEGLALHEIVLDEHGEPCDYRFLEINPAFEALTGLAAGDVIGKTAREAIPGLDPSWIERYAAVASTGVPARFEQYSSPLGRHFEVVAYSPRPGQFVTLFSDITERVEQAESQERARLLLEASLESQKGTILFSIDPQYRYLYFNKAHAEAMRQAYGRTVKLGDCVLDHITNNDDRVVAKDNYDRALAGESHSNIREFGDAAVAAYESYFNPIRDDRGTIIGATGMAHDITERIKQEKELRLSEERFSTLFQQAPLGYQSLDEDGCFIEVNQAWLDTLGYERHEVIGSWFGDFLAPEYVDAFRGRFPLFKERGAIHSEFQLMHKDGSRHFIAFDGRIGHNPDGSFRQTHCILAGVTERKHAEEALRESEMRYRAAIQTAMEGFWLVSADGRLLTVNDAYCRMSGYTVEELLGTRFSDLEVRESEDEVIDHIARVRAAGSDRFESIHRRKDGTTFSVEVSTSFSPADGGQFACFIRDVTDQKRAAQDLRDSEDKFRYLFDHSMVAKSITRPDGGLFVNDAFISLLGYSREELEDGATWRQLTHPDDIARSEEIVAAMLSGQMQSVRFTKRYVHKDGRIIHADVSTALRRNAEGDPEYFMTNIVDITERKNAEEAVLRLNAELEERVRERTEELTVTNEELSAVNAELEEATRAKSDFLASMSHEFRTPLNSIIGFSDLLEQGLFGDLEPEQARRVAMINAAGKHLLALVNDILDLSRIETGQTVALFEVCEAEPLVSSVMEMIAPLAAAKGIGLKASVASDLEPFESDPRFVSQILTNLLGNAVKFTDSGEVSLRVYADDDLVFEVADTGYGIPAAEIPLIMERFYQAESHPGAVREGTGLGLAISSQLAEILRASIGVESEVGVGSTFTLRIPRRAASSG